MEKGSRGNHFSYYYIQQYESKVNQIHPSRRLRPSAESLRRLVVRAGRLYEQGADVRRLWRYVTRWTRWLWGGLDGLVTRKGGDKRYMVYVLKQLQISGIQLPRA